MALVLDALVATLKRRTVAGVLSELMLFCAPLSVAVVVGLLLGWAWRPKWAAGLVCEEKEGGSAGPLSTSAASSEPAAACASSPSLEVREVQVPSLLVSDGSTLEREGRTGSEKLAVTAEDFEHLWQLVEETDGGPAWMQMMDRSLPTMGYKAWRRDPDMGPPQYRSRTVFEDAAPEIVRDFFWDDEFRTQSKWDNMLIYHETLEECPYTGTMVVHWVRKFPFFCSDREYIIGRRIWGSGRSYYCVTKGVPYPSVPRRNKPRRVELYYSSWCIRAVESSRGDGKLTACEVLLFHHEDMGIPWEIAKLGVRQGMWGTVKKIEPGFRAYQKAREAGATLSRCAFMAQINTKDSADLLQQLETDNDTPEVEDVQRCTPFGGSMSKFLIVGGAVVLACTLDRGLLTKTAIIGVARRFPRLAR